MVFSFYSSKKEKSSRSPCVYGLSLQTLVLLLKIFPEKHPYLAPFFWTGAQNSNPEVQNPDQNITFPQPAASAGIIQKKKKKENITFPLRCQRRKGSSREKNKGIAAKKRIVAALPVHLLPLIAARKEQRDRREEKDRGRAASPPVTADRRMEPANLGPSRQPASTAVRTLHVIG